MSKINNETSAFNMLFGYFKKVKKHNPQILIIPEEDYFDAKSHKNGKMVSLKNATIITGVTIEQIGKNPTIIITTERILKTLADQVKSGANMADLQLTADDIYIPEETIEKIEKELNKNENS